MGTCIKIPLLGFEQNILNIFELKTFFVKPAESRGQPYNLSFLICFRDF